MKDDSQEMWSRLDSLKKALSHPWGLSEGVGIEPRRKKQDMHGQRHREEVVLIG